jgi:hypothetical protein
MRVRKSCQRELFDDEPPAAQRTLPPEVRSEALRLLTQWLHTLSQAANMESGDEQDRR